MAKRIKPNYQRVWAETGNVTKPVDSYIQEGWLAVKPPREYMNWIQNRQDNMLAYINQLSITEWDANTDYHGGAGTATCSYVQGSDGRVYKCLADNGPSFVGAINKDPVVQPGNAAFWIEAFGSKAAVDANAADIATLETQMGDGSGVTNPASWRTKLSVPSLTEAVLDVDFTGTNQSQATTGHQVLPGGLILNWGTFSLAAAGSAGQTVTFSKPFTTAILFYGATPDVAADQQIGTDTRTLVDMVVRKGQGDTYARAGTWFALGF